MIRDATRGDGAAREAFGRAYLSVVRRYLEQRWRGSPLAAETDDAVQEVFVDLLREGGALSRVDPSRPGGFRAFLWGVTTNVALHFETRRARRHGREAELPADADALADDASSASAVFDREWARGVMRAAAARQELAAQSAGPEALRRCELLRLRFIEGLPIRDIAERWTVGADLLHHEYAQARAEFRQALRTEVATHRTQPAAAIDAECARLLSLLR